MPSINSVTWSSERLVVRAISTSDLSISDSSSLSITPLLSLSHMSKMMRNLSSVLPRENSRTVSRNSWNLNSSARREKRRGAVRRSESSGRLYLKRNPAVAVLVDNVEHLLDENRVGPHAESACKLAFGKRGAHHRDNLSGVTVFRSPSPLAGSQAESQGIRLSEELKKKQVLAMSKS